MPLSIPAMVAGDDIALGFPPAGGSGFRAAVAGAVGNRVWRGSQVDAIGLHHEGYMGATVGRVRDVLLGSLTSSGAIKKFSPIELILSAGLQDVLAGKEPRKVVDELHGLLDQVQFEAKTLQPYILELPKVPGFEGNITAVNSLLRKEASGWKSTTFSVPPTLVRLADYNEEYEKDPTIVLADKTHPNARGYAWIAWAVTNALGFDPTVIPVPEVLGKAPPVVPPPPVKPPPAFPPVFTPPVGGKPVAQKDTSMGGSGILLAGAGLIGIMMLMRKR